LAALVEDKTNKVHYLQRLTTLGSSPDCPIRISGAGVAPEVARIILEKEGFVLELRAKSAEVRLNGKAVKKALLSEGDRLFVFGKELIFSHFAVSPGAGRADLKGAALKSIHHFSLGLMNAVDLDTVFKELLDGMLSVTRADKGFLVLKEGEGYKLREMRNVEQDTADACGEVSDSIISRVLREKKPLLISDAPSDTQLGKAGSLIALKLKSVIASPLILDNEILGVLYLGSEKASNLFDEGDLDAVAVYAAHASLLIKNALLIKRLRDENEGLRDLLSGVLIYESQAMENLMRLAGRVAASDLPVLITGETGTGKELLARHIHGESAQKGGSFITVNCSAIPETLIESELFGHRKGAFTGAHADKLGKFELADKGTIFLDEIGDMPLPLQAKLLRVLEAGEVEILGGTAPVKISVRVIAATNRNLRDGGFRSDLYYRLCGVEIHVPPLRERGMDGVLIARALL
jgi:transcriptional regulator with GAF, ATPase, and Fis domain